MEQAGEAVPGHCQSVPETSACCALQSPYFPGMLSETDYAADSYLLEDLGRYVFVRDQLGADGPNIPTAAKLGSKQLAQSCNS